MSKKKIVIAAVSLLCLCSVFLLFTSPGKALVRNVFGVPSSTGAILGSHHLRMTDEQVVDLNKRALPPEEFEVWKAAWDLRLKSDQWKQENAELVKDIEARQLKRQREHGQMFRDDPKAYKKKYAPFFGEQRSTDKEKGE